MWITCIRKEVILLGCPCLASIMHCFKITWWCGVEHIHIAVVIHIPADMSKILLLQNLSIQNSITAFRNCQSSCNNGTVILLAVLYCNEIWALTFESRTKSAQDNIWMLERWNKWSIKVHYITKNFTFFYVHGSINLIFMDPCIVDDSVEIPTRCSFVIEFIVPKFIEGSTCFERHTAHHQEL